MARRRIVRLADGRKQDAQIVVNLGRRRDRGTRIGPRAPLLDRDRRRKPFDEIDVRLFHLVQELPGVGGEAFDVAALAFGIERVEGERGFPRAAQAGDYDQFFPRNLDVEILEIVLARTADLDSLRRHRTTNVEPVSQAQPSAFLQPIRPIMSDTDRTISQEELVELQKKFSEIKHSINNALAVMMALSEMSQRRPDYSEKLASTVLTKAPQIVSSLQEFTQALNEKAGPKPEVVP